VLSFTSGAPLSLKLINNEPSANHLSIPLEQQIRQRAGTSQELAHPFSDSD